MGKSVILTIVLILVVSFMATSCLGETEITGKEREQILVYANPVADNLLEGFNEKNYEKFSKDFDEQMKNAMTESAFLQTRQTIVGKIGLYISKKLSRVLKQDSYIFVIYSADFEKESGVEVKVAFSKYDGKNLVSGLWFNSPKLAQ